MSKLWQGDLHGALNAAADDFNSSISFDHKMYKQDIAGSVAHSAMLAEVGIISHEEAARIAAALKDISGELESGELGFDFSAEDIHSFVEQELVKRIGDAGKKLHTARSRNDQVALDLRLYLRDEADEIIVLLQELLQVLVKKAEEYSKLVMPGYTHLQRAQPVNFGQHLTAYSMSFCRDIERLRDCRRRINRSPLGAGALAGTGFPIDRRMTAELLGCEGICMNSMDAVSDRDFCVELASCLALIMTHLSRFSEELILWSSWDLKFITLSDSFTTGSSIMPQKKNPDMAELTRGKTGRVYGNLMSLLTVLKGLPLAYNKDMQEDKEAIFDSCKTVKDCLRVFAPMLDTMTAHADNMLRAAQKGFINATDLADYLTAKGMPFRDAYRVSGDIVALCIRENKVLEELPLETYLGFSDLFAEDLFEAIDLVNCCSKRTSLGGAAPSALEAQLEYIKEFIK